MFYMSYEGFVILALCNFQPEPTIQVTEKNQIKDGGKKVSNFIYRLRRGSRT